MSVSVCVCVFTFKHTFNSVTNHQQKEVVIVVSSCCEMLATLILTMLSKHESHALQTKKAKGISQLWMREGLFFPPEVTLSLIDIGEFALLSQSSTKPASQPETHQSQ